MCGICGFKRGENASIQSDAAVIKNMCDMLAHRGPDGEGFFIDGNVALGHRRLSLIDLPGGGQPMVRDIDKLSDAPSDVSPTPIEQVVAVTFNGEIYNYKELAKELSEQGWDFETSSDTEVIIAGYVLWGGLHLLQKIRGMFAFAIWDSRSKSLFCARDPFGIKPFYYAFNDQGNFVFASEAKAILRFPGFEKRLNRHALEHYLCFQFNPLAETFFKDIHKLAPAHFMVVSPDNGLHVERYWRPVFAEDEGLGTEEARKKIDEAIKESVKRHNIADVEVGAYLSGGIDSSYVASMLSNINTHLKTFTVGFAEYCEKGATTNEIEWAEGLASDMGTRQKSRRVTKADFFDAMKSVQYHMDEPTADPAAVPLYYLNQMASTEVKAVVSGEGADELFAGYRLYESPIAAKKLGFVPKGALRAMSKVFTRFNLRGANFMRRASSDVSEWYYTNANDKAFSKSDLRKLLRFPFSSVAPTQIVSDSYREAKKESLDEVKSMQLVDIEHWLVGDILAKTDRMSMASSVECRVPYLDVDVFDVAAKLPTRLNVSSKNTKIALRDAARGALPEKYAEKQKLGFPVPLSDWLREDEVLEHVSWYFRSDVAARFFNTRELMRLLDDQRSGKDMSRKIWIIWMFLIWHQVYFPEEWTEDQGASITENADMAPSASASSSKVQRTSKCDRENVAA